MNVERPAVGVPNCVICGVVLYLTTQNQNGSEIYQKIVENVITEQKVFHNVLTILR